MSTFLLVLWSGGGNVPPQLTLAQRLVERGHHVRVLAPAALHDAVERTGAIHEPYRQAPEHDAADPVRDLVRDFEFRSAPAMLRALQERLFIGMALPIAQDVSAILDEHPVDVIAPDWMMLGASFAAERAGIPAAPLVHSVAAFPVEGMPAYGMGFKPAAGPMGRARDRMGRMMFERMMDRPLLEPLNAVRAQLQLAPLESVFDWVLNHDPLLVLTSETFDFPARFPDTVRYVGPQLEEPEWCPVWEPPWEEADDGPLVVVGLSTTYQAHEDLLENVVEALGQLPVKALVTTGNLELLSRVPANVHTEPFVPHARVLPLADLVVTHAGHGTTMAALAHGVPMVCLPIGRDQPDIAARVVWHGAGIKLSPRSKPNRIARAISQVLSDDAYRRSARKLAHAIAAEEPRLRGVEALEQLASMRQHERPL